MISIGAAAEAILKREEPPDIAIIPGIILYLAAHNTLRAALCDSLEKLINLLLLLLFRNPAGKTPGIISKISSYRNLW